jgi:hypothetical protein
MAEPADKLADTYMASIAEYNLMYHLKIQVEIQADEATASGGLWKRRDVATDA